MEIIIKIKKDMELNNSIKNRKDGAIYSFGQYARVFNEKSTCWYGNLNLNNMFIKMSENHANDLLRSRGHLFLNEVFDLLGMSHTKAGAIVGWVFNNNNPIGDNYVHIDVVRATDKYIILDFNVDGCILDCLD